MDRSSRNSLLPTLPKSRSKIDLLQRRPSCDNADVRLDSKGSQSMANVEHACMCLQKSSFDGRLGRAAVSPSRAPRPINLNPSVAQPLHQLISALRSGHEPTSLLRRARSSTSMVQSHSASGNASVFAESLDLTEAFDEQHLSDLLDLVDSAALNLKASGLALLSQLCSVPSNLDMLIACNVLDEILLIITMHIADDDPEQIAVHATRVLNQMMETVLLRYFHTNGDDDGTFTPAGSALDLQERPSEAIPDLFARLCQTGIGVILGALRAALSSDNAALAALLLRSCGLITRFQNKGMQNLVFRGLLMIGGFNELLVSPTEIKVQSEALTVIKALIASENQSYFLETEFLSALTSGLFTGMCTYRLNALRVFAQLGKTSHGALRVVSHPDFGASILKSLNHANCWRLRQEAAALFTDLVRPQQLEVGVTGRMVGLLQQIEPADVAQGLHSALILSINGDVETAVTILELIVHFCLLEFREGLVHAEQMEHKKTIMGTVMAQHFKTANTLSFLSESIKQAGSSVDVRPPILLTTLLKTLNVINSQLPEKVRRRRSSLSVRDQPGVSMDVIEALLRSLDPDEDYCIDALEAIKELAIRFPLAAMAIFTKIHAALTVVIRCGKLTLLCPSIDLLRLLIKSHGDVAPGIISSYGGEFFSVMLESLLSGLEVSELYHSSINQDLIASSMDVIKLCTNVGKAPDLMYLAGVHDRIAELVERGLAQSGSIGRGPDPISSVVAIINNCRAARKLSALNGAEDDENTRTMRLAGSPQLDRSSKHVLASRTSPLRRSMSSSRIVTTSGKERVGKSRPYSAVKLRRGNTE